MSSRHLCLCMKNKGRGPNGALRRVRPVDESPSESGKQRGVERRAVNTEQTADRLRKLFNITSEPIILTGGALTLTLDRRRTRTGTGSNCRKMSLYFFLEFSQHS